MTVTYHRLLWLPQVLEQAGLKVVTYDGWKARGLSESQPFDPRYVVWHHDASAVGDSPGVPNYMIANFQTAAAQCWVSRQGVWHIIASGRAPHAGIVLPGMPNNYTSVGVETDHTSGEAWPNALLTSLRTGTAAILRHLGTGADGLQFHKTICSPPGRKSDPAGLDLALERQRVGDLIAPPAPAPIPNEPEDDVTIDDLVEALRDDDHPLTKQLRRHIREAVQAELVDERSGLNPGQ